MGLVFGTIFIIGRLTGILSLANVRQWLDYAQTINPLWVMLIIIALLYVDLLLSIPTLALTTLAGFFLGFPLGALTALIGVSLTASTAYFLSRQWGHRALAHIVKEDQAQQELVQAFHDNGPMMIVLARAAPMVPEITACLAGVTRMPFGRYATCFALGTVPYVIIASYAGSVSSISDPKPALIAAMGLYAVMWTSWYFFRRHQLNRESKH